MVCLSVSLSKYVSVLIALLSLAHFRAPVTELGAKAQL